MIIWLDGVRNIYVSMIMSFTTFFMLGNFSIIFHAECAEKNRVFSKSEGIIICAAHN